MSTRLHLFKSKIHRATVTHADLDYEGSVTISSELMDAAKLGDKVIIATFAEVDANEAKGWNPTVVLVDEKSSVAVGEYRELAGLQRRVAS